VSDIFDTRLDDPDSDGAAIDLFYQLHCFDRQLTRKHYRHIYDTFWERRRIDESPNPRAACRAAALTYIEEVVFGPREKIGCPECPPLPSPVRSTVNT
jgi:hypothetical protein